MRRRSFAIFVSETATTLSAPDASTSAVARRLRLEVVDGRRDREAGVAREVVAHARRELGMRVEAGTGRRSAERDLPEPRHRVLDPRDPLSDLSRVAGELLAERHRARHP